MKNVVAASSQDEKKWSVNQNSGNTTVVSACFSSGQQNKYHISQVKYYELYFIYLNIIYHKSNIMSHICHFLDFLDIIWGGSVPNVWPKDSFDIERRKVWLENSKSLAKKSFSWLNWTWSRFTALVIHQWNNLIIEGNQIESFSSK